MVTQKPTATARVSELLVQGKTGPEIATVLYEENYHYEDAETALRSQRFVVGVEMIMPMVPALHVSVHPYHIDPANPMSALAILIGVKEPRALPEVVWSPKLDHPEITAEKSVYRYPREDPHWVQATRVEENQSLGLPYVNIWVGEKQWRAICAGWSDPYFDQSKRDVLIEDDGDGWLKIWWFIADVEPAEKNDSLTSQ